MYDYKFRQEEFSFRKPQRRLRKLAFVTVALVLIGGLIYAFGEPDLGLIGTVPGKGTDSDIIPLQLPPHTNPPQGSHPVKQAPARPGPEHAD